MELFGAFVSHAYRYVCPALRTPCMNTDENHALDAARTLSLIIPHMVSLVRVTCQHEWETRESDTLVVVWWHVRCERRPTQRKRCSCCVPLPDTDALWSHTWSCRDRAPPRVCAAMHLEVTRTRSTNTRRRRSSCLQCVVVKRVLCGRACAAPHWA
ncbi:hypothetical protein TRVL_09732 [Trypanosoma vivax]|nr:hypothetical protein TRVL_09732 [Trypanosoma vivax]